MDSPSDELNKSQREESIFLDRFTGAPVIVRHPRKEGTRDNEEIRGSDYNRASYILFNVARHHINRRNDLNISDISGIETKMAEMVIPKRISASFNT
jgi:hypothetical protein